MFRRVHQRGGAQWASMLVLALLALRALVPGGFMPGMVDGRPSMVLCDGHGMAGHHHHAAGSAGSGLPAGTHGNPECPFAQSAGPSPLPELPVLATANSPVNGFTAGEDESQIRAPTGPRRQQTPRGPPLLV
jgi:hypothetical protein